VSKQGPVRFGPLELLLLAAAQPVDATQRRGTKGKQAQRGGLWYGVGLVEVKVRSSDARRAGEQADEVQRHDNQRNPKHPPVYHVSVPLFECEMRGGTIVTVRERRTNRAELNDVQWNR